MTSTVRWAIAFLLLCPGSLAIRLWASSDCVETISQEDGYKIRKVTIGARYLRLPPGKIPPEGSLYSPRVATELVHAVNDTVKADDANTTVQITGRIPVARVQDVTSCVEVVNASDCTKDLGNSRCVDITVEALDIGLDPANLASNLLPVPRSPRTTILSNVPLALKVFSPDFGLGSDKKLGFTASTHTETNLLDYGKLIHKDAAPISSDSLELRTSAQGSLNNPYYAAAGEVAYLHDTKGLARQYGINAEFDAGQQPLGQGNNIWDGVNVAGSLRLKPHNPFVSNLCLNLGYRWANNRVSETPQNIATPENSASARMLLDLRWRQSFTRLSLWFDGGVPEKSSSSYRRLASMVGWQKDFGKGTQTFGVEVIAGGGHGWGIIPDYSRFFGGNLGANFIYADPTSPGMLAFPRGPVLRSYGLNQVVPMSQAGSLGGTSYWHFNVNVAIPIRGWSRPLIPDETICKPTASGEDKCETLAEFIKNQSGTTAKSFLTTVYKNKGLTKSEAEQKAADDLKGVSTIVGYIVDRANLYAFKPLIMTDGGNVYGPSALASQARFSVGGGVQFVLVTAKFETGYLRSVPTFAGQSSGNFVMRVVFQNFF